MKVPMIAEGEEVQLQALALHKVLIRYIGYDYRREIRLPRYRAKAGELRAIEFYEIIIARVLVRKPFKQ
jgi:hypothetical protein